MKPASRKLVERMQKADSTSWIWCCGTEQLAAIELQATKERKLGKLGTFKFIEEKIILDNAIARVHLMVL